MVPAAPGINAFRARAGRIPWRDRAVGSGEGMSDPWEEAGEALGLKNKALLSLLGSEVSRPLPASFPPAGGLLAAETCGGKAGRALGSR